MYSKEIAKWLLDQEEKIKNQGSVVLGIKWFAHDGSNNPQFVADIENATNMGRIEVWDTVMYYLVFMKTVQRILCTKK